MHIPEGWELILVLLVIIVVFGAKRLPDSARALGRSMRILKAETKGLRDDEPTTTTVKAVTPVQPAQPIVTQPVVTAPVMTQPVVAQPAQAYAGQQLFDAEGRPVQVAPAAGQHAGAGSSQVQPSPQA